ncbi:hypothetical protein KC19_8G184200 [Ceratodon purpureus]|uniref:Uncharacterized protein n=1 Tax=Ceratodon purpureus TaxID=3225 RepID=A0A8T0H0B8_CERPU|nr:hypothetical protein KC19_8G184200 [Ceratodon purpureus]
MPTPSSDLHPNPLNLKSCTSFFASNLGDQLNLQPKCWSLNFNAAMGNYLCALTDDTKAECAVERRHRLLLLLHVGMVGSSGYQHQQQFHENQCNFNMGLHLLPHLFRSLPSQVNLETSSNCGFMQTC